MFRMAGTCALFLCGAAEAAGQTGGDGNEYRSTQVEGWEIVQPELVANPEPYDVVSGASMRRRSDGYLIEYEVQGGLRRTISVQRLSCGEATDENGGAAYGDTLYATGSAAETAAAVRAAAREVDAEFDDACPPRPAQLEAALAGLETALATTEQWGLERRLPEAEAWERGSWSMERSEPPVTIRYARPVEGTPDRQLSVTVEGCGGIYGYEEATALPIPADAAGRGRARAALAGLLRQATERCRLPPEQSERLIAGFEEAVARVESEF